MMNAPVAYGIFEMVARSSGPYDSEPWEEPETEKLFAASANRADLIRDFNVLFADPKTISSYRGVRHLIDPLTGLSQKQHSHGGGCNVLRGFECRGLPHLALRA